MVVLVREYTRIRLKCLSQNEHFLMLIHMLFSEKLPACAWHIFVAGKFETAIFRTTRSACGGFLGVEIKATGRYHVSFENICTDENWFDY